MDTYFDEDVFWFYISVKNAISVQIKESLHLH